VNFILNRGKELSAPSTPGACQLSSRTLLKWYKKYVTASASPYWSVRFEMQFTPKLAYFHTVSNADITKLMQAGKRSPSLADPIPVPLRCIIINSVCPSITNFIISLAPLYPRVLSLQPSKSVIVRPILKKPSSDPGTSTFF